MFAEIMTQEKKRIKGLLEVSMNTCKNFKSAGDTDSLRFKYLEGVCKASMDLLVETNPIEFLIKLAMFQMLLEESGEL